MQFRLAVCRRNFFALALAGGAGLSLPVAGADPDRALAPLRKAPMAADGAVGPVGKPLGRDFAQVPIFPPGQRVMVAGSPRAPQRPQGDARRRSRLAIVCLGLGSTLLALFSALALRRGQSAEARR